jgi:hypothetical protein
MLSLKTEPKKGATTMTPDDRIRFNNGDKVEVAIGGNLNNVVNGTILGIVSDDLVTIWIVKFAKPHGDYPFSAAAFPHFHIRYAGSNSPFPHCMMAD